MNGVSLGVRFDGCFMHVPLRYQDGKILILVIRRMAYEEFSEFLKNNVGFAHEAVDTTIMDEAKNEVEYDKESMHTEEAAIQTKQIEIGLTDQVERATQDEVVQGEDNPQ
ncbi:hypothetical protein Tco_0774648 [Tanacetum coccineum]|uniref:Uncharacterized protein n=1 Tax=Tanacetum coccineum TaxID=301880 RepID=A0ABQ4ZQ18_9ASTR